MEINGTDAIALDWVNGPAQTISGTGNPANGRLGFGGDSRGYVASRVDLTTFAGTSVTPRFSFNANNSAPSFIGWFVDDITVYTCDATPTVGNIDPPTISGTPSVGQVLGSQPGTWSTDGVTFGYEWLRNGTAIPGATGSTYPVVAADAGSLLSLRVTGSKAGFASGTATSNSLGPVVVPPTPKVVAGAPTIKGKAIVGKKLTAIPGSWTPADVTFTYQWLRNGKPIAGATGVKYKLKNKDKGKRISVTVTGSKSGFTSASATSPKTKKVKPKPHHRVAVGAARLE